MIKSEYWIRSSQGAGKIVSAPGAVEDATGYLRSGLQHDESAHNFLCSKYWNKLVKYTEETLNKTGLVLDNWPYNRNDKGEKFVSLWEDVIHEMGKDSYEEAEEELKRVLKITDQELYEALMAKENAMLYVLKNLGWIAVRQQNIELYGLDTSRAYYLKNGLEKIFEKERIVDPSYLKFVIEDKKTGRIMNNISFDDISEGNFFKANLAPTGDSGYVPYPKGYKYESVLIEVFMLSFHEWLKNKDLFLYEAINHN